MINRHGKILLFILAFILIINSPAYSSESQALTHKTQPSATINDIPQGSNQNIIIMKIVDLPNLPRFTPNADKQAGIYDKLDALLSEFANDLESISSRRRVSLKKEIKTSLQTFAQNDIHVPDLDNYFELQLNPDLEYSHKVALINGLNDLEIVEIACFEPIPSPPDGSTPSWQSQQFYLEAAPDGIDALTAWSETGGKGDDITIVDIEGNWVEHHEDLHGGLDSFYLGGGKYNTSNWWHHGTAVLGLLTADSNSFGVTGIATEAEVYTIGIAGWSLADAIIEAINNTEAGDIILIEIQFNGPNGGAEIPVEYYQEFFDAIYTASLLGRIVIEPAGNGNQYLNNYSFYGSLFDPAYRFSGAIMVGAADSGHVPTGLTNYGARLDLHAPGSGVYTLGYGDLYGSDTTDYYTAMFNETSSASAIVAGACPMPSGYSQKHLRSPSGA